MNIFRLKIQQYNLTKECNFAVRIRITTFHDLHFFLHRHLLYHPSSSSTATSSPTPESQFCQVLQFGVDNLLGITQYLNKGIYRLFLDNNY